MQHVRFETGLADAAVDAGGAVHAVLHAALPGFVDDGAQLVRVDNRAGLGAGHHAPRTQDAAQAAHHPHHVRGGQDHVEVGPALLDARGQFLAANLVGTGRLGHRNTVRPGKDHDADRAARAVGQGCDASDLLFGLAWIQGGAEVQLHRFVELGAGALLDDADGVFGGMDGRAVKVGRGLAVTLALLCHGRSPAGMGWVRAGGPVSPQP